MDYDQSPTTEWAPIASNIESDTRHLSTEKRHVPTDSMVTVRLSDSPQLPTLDTSVQAHDQRPEFLESSTEILRRCLEDHEHRSVDAGEKAAKVEDTPIVGTQRGSQASMLSALEEGSLASATSTVRSRSDSSVSSSNGSAQFDWDELERNEEQAPRDEGSDEVQPHHLRPRLKAY